MKDKVLISGFLTFVLSLFVVIYWALLKTNFNFTYPLDDSYIHLAIAKNLTQYGVWGVTQFEFTSASSSPLYTIFISTLIKMFGNNLYLPMILNISIGFAIIVITSKFIEEQFTNIPKVYQLLVLNCFILFLPLHTLVFLAMEHTLHCLFVLLLFIELYKYLNSKITNQYMLPLYSLLSISTRYETIFILIPITLLFLYRKDYKLLFLIIITSAISIFGFGIYFISKGGRLLPYSVLVKGDSPQMSIESIIEYIKVVWMKFKVNKGISPLFIVIIIALLKQKIRFEDIKKSVYISLLLIVATVTFIHTFVGGPGHFFRYEAYIITMYLFVILSSFKNIDYNGIAKLFIFIILTTFAVRVYLSFTRTSQASQNIYEQQIQMANYITKHKEIKSVAVNDIGAIAYFNNDLRILDVWALATPELSEYALWEKKSGLPFEVTTKMKKELIGKLSAKKNVTHVFIYPKIFGGIVQDNWQVYDSLVMKSKRVVCADTLVYYYKVRE